MTVPLMMTKKLCSHWENGLDSNLFSFLEKTIKWKIKTRKKKSKKVNKSGFFKKMSMYKNHRKITFSKSGISIAATCILASFRLKSAHILKRFPENT